MNITRFFLSCPCKHSTIVLDSEDLRIIERGVVIATASPAWMEGCENLIGLLILSALAKSTPSLVDASIPGSLLRASSVLHVRGRAKFVMRNMGERGEGKKGGEGRGRGDNCLYSPYLFI
jgi:hypothetical protein